ncbi:hypothetical protein [Sphingopyxis sp. 550A]
MTDPIEIMARAHWIANSRPSSRSWDELKPNERTQKRNAIRTSLHALRASGFDVFPLEPTEAMLAAGANETPDEGSGSLAAYADAVWAAMTGVGRVQA